MFTSFNITRFNRQYRIYKFLFFSFFSFFVIQIKLFVIFRNFYFFVFLFRCLNFLFDNFNFFKFFIMRFFIIDEIDDQIQINNDFRKTKIIYTQKWKKQKIVNSFHWQNVNNNEFVIDFENTYLLNDEMLFKFNFLYQIWFQLCIFVVNFVYIFNFFFIRRSLFTILQQLFKLNFWWTNV